MDQPKLVSNDNHSQITNDEVQLIQDSSKQNLKVLNEMDKKSLIVEISKALNTSSIVMLTMEDDTFRSQFGPELKNCMQNPRLQIC